MDAIYLVLGGESKGPFTLAQVRAMLASGQATRETSAWHDGMAEWAPLGGIIDRIGGTAPVGGAPAIPAPVPVTFGTEAGTFSKPELRDIAKSQNMLMWAVAAGFFAFFIAHIPLLGIPGVLAIAAFEIYALCMLGQALRFSTVSLVLLSLTMFIPCVSLLVLVLVSGRASKILKANGVRVGLMGGNADDIKD